MRGEGRLRAAGPLSPLSPFRPLRPFRVRGDWSGFSPNFRFWVFLQNNYFSRAFFEDSLPEMLSKVGVLAERSMKKSQKHHTIARRSHRAMLFFCFIFDWLLHLKHLLLRAFPTFESISPWKSFGKVWRSSGRALVALSLSLYIYIHIYIYIYVNPGMSR